MGPFLLVLLVSSGVSVFSLAPEPSDDEVSSTSSLVSRLKQVKVMKLIKVIINLLISDCRQGEEGEAPVLPVL